MAMTQVWFGNLGLGSAFFRPYAAFESKNTESLTYMVCSAAGTFKNFRVKLSVAPGGAATRTITFRVNGADTTLQCAFGSADTDKRDTTHAITVAAGDVISVGNVSASFPAATSARYTLEFEPTTVNHTIYGGSSPNGTSSTDPVQGLFTSNQQWKGAGTDVANLVSIDGALTRLDYKLSVAPGVGNTITYTVYKNGSATGASVTVSGTATTGSWVGTIPLAIGDVVHQEMTFTGSYNSPAVGWGARFTSSLPGYAMVTGQRQGTPSTSVVNYQMPHAGNGPATYSTTETDVDYLGPITPRALRGLILDVNIAPGGGKSWTITTRRNGATVADSPTAVLSGTSVTASDSTHLLQLVDTDTWALKSTPAGTPTASDLAWAWQMVAPDFTPGAPSGDEVTFDNGVLTIGLTWIIVTTRSGTQYVWSDRPLPDPSSYYLGWKEPRVIQWGRIRRALSGFDGQYETSDFTVTLSDTDRLLRQLDADKELVNATVAVYMISDEGRRALETARTVYRGVIRDASPQGTLEYQITIKDTFEESFSINSDVSQVPERTVTTTDFANASAVLVNSSAEGYEVDGAVSAGKTQVPVKTGWGLFAERDVVTFGAGADRYTIASMSSCFDTAVGGDAETYIIVDPPLAGSLSNGDAITQVPTHTVAPSVGLPVPFWYGFISDRKVTGGIDSGDGQGPMLFVGDKVLSDGKSYGEFLWAGHACYAPSGIPIPMPYFWNEALDDLSVGYPLLGDLTTAAGSGGRIALPGYANWTTLGFTDAYVDYNGRRYTVLYLRGIFRDWALGIRAAPVNLGGVPFGVNAYGAETVGDSSGTLIVDGFKQYKHLVQNWIPPKGTSYQGGAWLASPTFVDDPTLPMIDEDSFDIAHDQSAVYVTDGFRGDFGVGVGGEAISRRALIARLNISFGCECGFNRKTQFFVSLVNTDLASTTQQPALTYVRDIFSGTWSIEPVTRELYTALPYRHTQDFFNRALGGWRSVTTGVVETENTGASTAYGSKSSSPTLFFYMLRGKNRSDDINDYQRGSDTIDAVLALKLSRSSTVPHLPKWQTGPAGFNYELADVVPITHYEGLSSTGWTDRPIRIERTETDPSNFTEAVEGFDLDPVLV